VQGYTRRSEANSKVMSQIMDSFYASAQNFASNNVQPARLKKPQASLFLSRRLEQQVRSGLALKLPRYPEQKL
jgi:hypothetical protein